MRDDDRVVAIDRATRKQAPIRRLSLIQLKRLDNMLEGVGEFGSVTLVVEKGVVKFVEVTVSKKL